MTEARPTTFPTLTCTPYNLPMPSFSKAAPSDQFLEPRYLDATQVELPHVVKFSGGRSSAAMTLLMARNDLLDPNRGDVVLFANTTTEHPATYEFAARVCDEIESKHGVPCIWYEFCSVEVAGRNGWTRTASYRLVKRVEATPDDDPAIPGFRADGTAFEEMASLKGMIPNRKMRFCTQELKVLPGIALIADWLGGGPGPDLAGHDHGRSLSSPDDAAARYQGTRMTYGEIRAIREFAYRRPWMRPAQQWSDFSGAISDHRNGGPRRRVDLAGRTGPPERYVTLLGLRADEPKRVNRALFEAMLADGAKTSSCRHESHPAGESIVAPLFDTGWAKSDVERFWSAEPYDLEIDSALGNCVYCFMKGETAIRRLALRESPRRGDIATPANIRWWADLEQRYAGKSDDEYSDRFNFLATRSASYADIIADPSAAPRNGSASLPCACTD